MPVHFQHFHQHFIAFLHLIGHLIHAMVRQLGDVHQSIHPRQHLDERAKIHDLLDLAEIQFSNLHFFGDLVHAVDRLFGRGFIVGGDRHGAIVLHVHLDAAGRDNVPDNFSAWSDHFADLVGLNLQGVDAWRIRRHGRPWRFERRPHSAENVHPALARLRERLLHEFGGNPSDLDIHLKSRHSLGGSTDLEIHVTQMILQPQDIGEHHHLLPFLDGSHRDARHGFLERHAGIHECQTATAYRRHRGRSVGLENVRHEAQRIGKILFGRQHRLERPFSERSMPDLAPAWGP